MKLKNLLAENMRRFRTKNLNEDSDQNNNGYPDDTENSFLENDPILKKYGFDHTDSPDTLMGKLATRANLKDVTTVAYFDNSKWNLPAEPFSANKIRNKIHTTLEKTLSKHIGGKLKSIWGSFNADLPDNITALAMSSGDATSITIDHGIVSGMDREVTGTYNGKSFELETSDGMTTIYLNGKHVDDDDVYDDILNAVNNRGYVLEENMHRFGTKNINELDTYVANATGPLNEKEIKIYEHILSALELCIPNTPADVIDDFTDEYNKDFYLREFKQIIQAVQKLADRIEQDMSK
jgi:hypothetical protein